MLLAVTSAICLQSCLQVAAVTFASDTQSRLQVHCSHTSMPPAVMPVCCLHPAGSDNCMLPQSYPYAAYMLLAVTTACCLQSCLHHSSHMPHHMPCSHAFTHAANITVVVVLFQHTTHHRLCGHKQYSNIIMI